MRTIQFDVSAVQKAGEKLTKSALGRLQMLKSEVPLEYQHFLEDLASDTISLDDARGYEKRVRMVIAARPSGKPGYPLAGGLYVPDPGSVDLITIFYNSEHTPFWFHEYEKTGALSKLTSRYMLHEFTHAADVLGKIDNKYPGLRSGLRPYYNQPFEFRAYAKETIVGVLGMLSEFQVISAESIETLLKKSPDWGNLSPFLDSRHQKRLRQMLVREIQDSGRTIEGVDRDVRLPGSAP